MNSLRNNLGFLLLSVSLISLIACNEGVILNEHTKFENGRWSRNQKVSYEYEVPSQDESYDIYLHFRHTGKYPYENIYFFIETLSPDNKYARDTAQMILANKKGRFLGNGIGDIFDYEFKFKEGVKFPVPGVYRLSIEQAMRVSTIEEVTDFGVRIEKSSIE